jgi:hypothetical protein
LEPAALSKLTAKDAALTARFLHCDFHVTNTARGKLPTDSALNLFGDIFSQEFGTGVGERKQDYVTFRQENLLLPVINFDRIVLLSDFQFGTLSLDHSPVVEIVTHALHQRLEGNKIQHYSGPVQFPFQGDCHLIVMTMERFSLAVGKDQKMCGSEIEIVLGNFDAKAVWHEADVNQKPWMIQVREQTSSSGASTNLKARNNEVRKRKMTLKISQSDAFATPGFHLASGLLSLTAESGFRCEKEP